MKKSFLLGFSFLLVASISYSQGRTHSGFYFSMGLGPAWGTSNGYDNQGSVAIITGTGVEFDFQMGGSITKNIILHGTITGKVVAGPQINGTVVSDDYSLSETMIGGGITHYTPRNFFLTGNLGAGKFTFSQSTGNSYNSNDVSTKYGFSLLLKAGKEFWISKKLGLGVAVTYGKTMVNSTEGTYTEKWNSNRYGVLLQLTID
ncbi:MAG: hypothetical protein ABI663_02825 [Chryseolinea sp.]